VQQSLTIRHQERSLLRLQKNIEPSFTITTKGSYIEYKIGTNVKVVYDNIHYLPNRPILTFKTVIDGSMEANFQFTMIGHAEAEVVKPYNITSGIDLEIVHYASPAVKTSVHLQPVIEFGASGEITAEAYATAKAKRAIKINLDYQSDRVGDKLLTPYVTYEEELEDMDESNMGINLEANAILWATPNLEISPQVKLLRVSSPLQMGNIRAGVQLQTELNGKLESSFTVTNDKGQYDAYAEVGVKVGYFPLIQAMFDVRVGEKIFFETDRLDLYKGETNYIFDWNARIIKKPTIIAQSISDEETQVRFELDMGDENLTNAIQFYYTLDGSTPVFEKNGVKWNGSPLSIKSTTSIKVIAVLQNKDIVDSIWAFGTSVSQAEEEFVEFDNIAPPTANPPSDTTFEDKLNITLTQSQDYPIYYTIDGTLPSKASLLYSESVEITEDTTLQAITFTDDGNASDVVSFNYYIQDGLTSDGYCPGAQKSCAEGYELVEKTVSATQTNQTCQNINFPSDSYDLHIKNDYGDGSYIVLQNVYYDGLYGSEDSRICLVEYKNGILIKEERNKLVEIANSSKYEVKKSSEKYWTDKGLLKEEKIYQLSSDSEKVYECLISSKKWTVGDEVCSLEHSENSLYFEERRELKANDDSTYSCVWDYWQKMDPGTQDKYSYTIKQNKLGRWQGLLSTHEYDIKEMSYDQESCTLSVGNGYPVSKTEYVILENPDKTYISKQSQWISYVVGYADYYGKTSSVYDYTYELLDGVWTQESRCWKEYTKEGTLINDGCDNYY
jgi:hypothetical protein